MQCGLRAQGFAHGTSLARMLARSRLALSCRAAQRRPRPPDGMYPPGATPAPVAAEGTKKGAETRPTLLRAGAGRARRLEGQRRRRPAARLGAAARSSPFLVVEKYFSMIAAMARPQRARGARAARFWGGGGAHRARALWHTPRCWLVPQQRRARRGSPICPSANAKIPSFFLFSLTPLYLQNDCGAASAPAARAGAPSQEHHPESGGDREGRDADECR